MSETEKAEANQQEPSMEDILASIRRILSEDGDDEQAAATGAASGTGGSGRGGSPPDARMPKGNEQVEEAPMTAEDDRTRSNDRGDQPGHRPERRPERRPEPGDKPAAAAADKEAVPEIELADVLDLTPEMQTGPVLSSPTSTASSDALAQLAKAILDRRDVAIGSRDVTLEGMVREMLRPMLKEWLDRNLPYLIERLVKKEIDLMVNRAERLED
jgi:uncharacterized protein